MKMQNFFITFLEIVSTGNLKNPRGLAMLLILKNIVIIPKIHGKISDQ